MPQQRHRKKKRVQKKKGPTTKTLAKEIKHIKNDIIELKFNSWDSVAPFTLGTTYSVSSFACLIGGGSSEEQRVGNQISPTSISLRFRLLKNTSRLVDEQVRFLLFWDKQVNGAAPTVMGAGGVLDNSVITNPIFAPHNFDTNKRYTILKDKVYRLPAGSCPITITNNTSATASVTQTTQTSKYVKIYKKLGRVVKYIDNGNTITSLVTNGLYMAWCSDASSNGADCEFGAIMYFRDA